MDIKYGSSATRVKIYAAKGVRYFSNIHVAEFLMENDELHVGDEIVISGPTTGAIIMKVEEIRVDLKPVEKTVRGERFSIKSTNVCARATNSTCGAMWRKCAGKG